MKMILGSSSAGRKLVMSELGYDFEVMAPGIDEKAIRRNDPQELVMAIAHAKADALLPQIHEPALLIVSDQVVLYQGEVREKPVDEDENKRFLESYANEPFETCGAVVVVNTDTRKRAQGLQAAKVYLKPFPKNFIEAYTKTGEGLRGAGGLMIQNPVFASYIDHIEGAFDSLVGLSKEVLQKLIQEASNEVGTAHQIPRNKSNMESESLTLARTFLGKNVHLEFDQPVGSSYPPHGIESYPINYGYVPNVPAPDGDDLDAYLLNVFEPMREADGICIAIIHRLEDDDDKLIVVPDGIELSDEEILKQVAFQEHLYKGVIVRK